MMIGNSFSLRDAFNLAHTLLLCLFSWAYTTRNGVSIKSVFSLIRQRRETSSSVGGGAIQRPVRVVSKPSPVFSNPNVLRQLVAHRRRLTQ
jgi:hypothetical protein